MMKAISFFGVLSIVSNIFAAPMSVTTKELIAELNRRSENNVTLYSEASCLSKGEAPYKEYILQVSTRNLLTGVWKSDSVRMGYTCDDQAAKLNAVLNAWDNQTYNIMHVVDYNDNGFSHKVQFTVLNGEVSIQKISERVN